MSEVEIPTVSVAPAIAFLACLFFHQLELVSRSCRRTIVAGVYQSDQVRIADCTLHYDGAHCSDLEQRLSTHPKKQGRTENKWRTGT